MPKPPADDDVVADPDVDERESARVRDEHTVLENGRRLLDEARRTIEQLDRLLGPSSVEVDHR